MPNKITLEVVKSKLPPFVKIVDETYKGVRYSADFIDVEYKTKFTANVGSVIKLQHGCKNRADSRRGGVKETGKYIRLTAQQVQEKLPKYLILYQDTYKGSRYKAQFHDIEYNEDFEAYCCNVLRDGKGYCKERRKKEFIKSIFIPVQEIQSRIDELYGKDFAIIDPLTYKGTNEVCTFRIDGKILRINAQEALKGNLTKDRTKLVVWRQNVMLKWGNKCAFSGASKHLEMHHIYAYKTYPEYRYEINNGIALSYDIHREFHRIYGKTGNTKSQLSDFAKSKGVDLTEALKDCIFDSKEKPQLSPRSCS